MKADRTPDNDFQEEVTQNTDPVSDPLTAPTSGADGDSVTDTEPVTLPGVPRPDFHREDALTLVTAERDALLDRMARMQAEFENARRRDGKERTEFRDFAVSGIVEQLLPVMDNFSLALKSQGTAEQIRVGVEAIYRQMEEILRNAGVQEIPSVGVPFNPHVHEALGHVETEDVPDEHVAEEIRKGYKLKERLLRPAMVRVATNAAVGAR